MSKPRRIGSEQSATRSALLDAALQLMLEEGYAAVTSRRLAAKAGLKPQLVHYYFRTMDDLFVALVRRGAEQNLARQERALASPQPIRALWEQSSDPAGSVLTAELAALANHRKAIRTELAAFAEEFRRIQHLALDELLERYGVDTSGIPPGAAPVILTGLSQIIGLEEALGFTTGHDALRRLVEDWIARHEGAAPVEPPPSGASAPASASGS